MKRRLLRLTAAALPVFLLLAAVLDSRYSIKTTEYTLRFDALPQEFDGMRIVHLSDLHGTELGRGNRRLIDAVLSARPDLIVMTGDMISNADQIPVFEALVRGISGAAPMYYVNGNHEWAGRCVDSVEAMLEKYSVRCLRNEYEPIYKPGTEAHFIIGGADDPNGHADMKKPDALTVDLSHDYPGDFVLWLCHRNDYVTMYPDAPVDLILCGHAHGGIIRLPLVGGLLNLEHRLGAEYEKGLYYGQRFVMEVSCGLGNSIVVPRLFNRPELVVLTLKSGGNL